MLRISPSLAMTADAATTWGVGDYALIAERLEPAARAVVDLAGVTDSDRVLDVATGTGNAALLAASRGATVVGLDFEPRLLDIARARARSANLEVEWVHADFESAPLERAAFSVVVSVFGVMYAPDHDAAAARTGSLLRPRGPARARRLDARKLHAGDGSGARPVPAAAAPGRGAAESLGRRGRPSPSCSSGTGSAHAQRPPSRCRYPSPIAPRRSTS